MTPASHNYFPLSSPFIVALAVALLLVVAFVELRALTYAYRQMGIDRRWVLALLLVSLAGSYVNVPVAELPAGYVHSGEIITAFGVQYVVPFVERVPRTIIAVNLGGGLIPAALSLYLLVVNRLWVRGVLAVAVVAAAAHAMARPVPGLGIAEPIFVPPIVAAVAALILSRRHPGPLAYAGGSLGTLIGADLLNLDQIQGLGAPVASIGGAGTFDGVFLSGILGVLLAAVFGAERRRRHAAPPRSRSGIESDVFGARGEPRAPDDHPPL